MTSPQLQESAPVDRNEMGWEEVRELGIDAAPPGEEPDDEQDGQ